MKTANPTNLEAHTNTPTIAVLDNRGLAIRNLTYYRSSSADPVQEGISRSTFSALGAIGEQYRRSFYLLSIKPTPVVSLLTFSTKIA